MRIGIGTHFFFFLFVWSFVSDTLFKVCWPIKLACTGNFVWWSFLGRNFESKNPPIDRSIDLSVNDRTNQKHNHQKPFYKKRSNKELWDKPIGECTIFYSVVGKSRRLTSTVGFGDAESFDSIQFNSVRFDFHLDSPTNTSSPSRVSEFHADIPNSALCCPHRIPCFIPCGCLTSPRGIGLWEGKPSCRALVPGVTTRHGIPQSTISYTGVSREEPFQARFICCSSTNAICTTR